LSSRAFVHHLALLENDSVCGRNCGYALSPFPKYSVTGHYLSQSLKRVLGSSAISILSMAPAIQRCFARVALPWLRLSAFGRAGSFLSSYPLPPTRCSPNGGPIRALHSGWPRRLAAVGTAVQYKQSDRQSLPATSVEDQRVSITWDAQTRSRLCVVKLLSHGVIRRSNASTQVTIFGYEITAGELSLNTKLAGKD
jgi:hypothetical protein